MKQFPIAQFQGLRTPFYYYDTALLRQTLQAIHDETSRHERFFVHYAVKANANPRLLRIISQAGLGADCVSGGEIETALKTGFSPSKIVYAGVGKSDWEIQLGLQHGIFSFNVESTAELKVINELATSSNTIAPVALRVNPDVGAHTHANITTGLAENKFGNHLSCKALAQNMQAVCHLMVQNFGSAEDCLKQSLLLAEQGHINKVKHKVLNNYAVLYRLQGKLDDAIGCLRQMEESIHSDDELFMCYLNMGNTYLAQRKPKEAMKEYEKAVVQEKNPFYKAAMYHNMGVILQSQKQFGPAIDCYKNSLRNYPVDDRTRYNLALCQHQLKNQPKDQNQQSQSNNQDQKKNEQQQKQPQKQDEQQRQEQKSQMSKENADQMLRAAMMQENRTQQKLNQHKQRPRRRNAEKNW